MESIFSLNSPYGRKTVKKKVVRHSSRFSNKQTKKQSCWHYLSKVKRNLILGFFVFSQIRMMCYFRLKPPYRARNWSHYENTKKPATNYLSVRLSINLSVYLSLGLSICQYIFFYFACLSFYPSIYMTIYQSVSLSVCLSFYLSVVLFDLGVVCLSFILSSCLTDCLLIRLSVRLSVLLPEEA